MDQFTVRVKFCVVVADPEVAVIVRMYLPDGVLKTGGGVDPLLPEPAQPEIANVSMTTAKQRP